MSGKFTIQQMLWATLAFGFVAMAITAAYRGNVIAFGVLIAPLFMTITFGVLAMVYWLSYFVCRSFIPPIHTPTPADFSATQPQQSSPTNRIADSRYASPTAMTDDSSGESE